MDDLELVAKYRNCDDEAYDQLYQRYAEKTAHCIKKVSEYKLAPEDVQDIGQETWIKAMRLKTASHPPQKQFEKWIYAVAANTTIDWLRKHFKRLRRTHSLSAPDDEKDKASRQLVDNHPQTDFPAQIGNRELAEKLLSALSEKERIVYLLYHAHEFKQREIAELLSVAPGTVASLLSRAHKKLKSIVAEALESNREF